MSKNGQNCVRLSHGASVAAWEELTRPFRVEISSVSALEVAMTKVRKCESLELPTLRVAVEKHFEDCPNDFVEKVIPFVCECALALPDLFPESTIDILASRCEGIISLSRKQVCCLICCGFLGVLPSDNAPKGSAEERRYVGDLSFDAVLIRKDDAVAVARTQCLLEYFRCILKDSSLLLGSISVRRQSCPVEDGGFWSAQAAALQPAEMALDRIEDDLNFSAHVDFANRYLMVGEVLPSATQEEICFSTRPEMFASILFVERMEAEDIVIFHGCRRFSDYDGYGGSFRFRPLQKFEDAEQIPPILAMDAHMNYGNSQFHMDAVHQDLHKALLAFRSAGVDRVSTGLWGCGAFGGNPVLKFIQQVMVAAVAGVSVRFSIIGSHEASLLSELNELIRGRSVTEMYALVVSDRDIFIRPRAFDECVLRHLRGDATSMDISPEELEGRRLWIQGAVYESNMELKAATECYRSALKLWPGLDTEGT